MKYIPLTQGLRATVDDEDFERLNQFRWCAHKIGHSYRAMRRQWVTKDDTFIVYMHRQVLRMEQGDGRIVDHVSGDGLDNRKTNLRFATKASNAWNSRKRSDNTSGYKGVSRESRRGVWQAQIVANGEREFIGYFPTAEQAHTAYSERCKALHGEFARPQ